MVSDEARPSNIVALKCPRRPLSEERGPLYRLRRVTLPLIAPYLIAAFGLSFALSMGELGATVMVYPPGWVTLPVDIFSLTDRGDIFTGAALTMVLVVVTLSLLLALERVADWAAGSR